MEKQVVCVSVFLLWVTSTIPFDLTLCVCVCVSSGVHRGAAEAAPRRS